METRELFLREYQTRVLDKLVLPPSLREQYCPQACLKDGERQVYLVHDRAGCPAVLKIQPAGREDALQQEYELLQGLRHPQIPQPLAYLEWEGMEYLVREYVEGVSLHEQVIAQGPFSPDKVREIALSLCHVLQYLHSQNPPVICRDVKPQNVVLDPSGRCHLIDLGAARRHRPEQQGDTVFLGTQVTAPPEQFGYQQTDQRSDLYSLGILMRFLLTGSYAPSDRGTGFGYLCRVIRRCTAFDPKNRYSSVRAVYRALKYRWLRLGAAVAAGMACTAIILGLLWSSAAEAQLQSSLLEDALRQELQLGEGEPIPAERLGEVEQLLVCGPSLVGSISAHDTLKGTVHDRGLTEIVRGNITDEDLAVLSECVNLRVLILDYQEITDLSPLAGLPLEYLSLAGNQISDLSPLAGCGSLQTVDLAENPVRSAEVLAGLPALREVTLDFTGITSVEDFAGTSIRSLSLFQVWISDYTPLEECPALTRLVVSQLSDSALESLMGLAGLEELRMYTTAGVDLSRFEGFQNLRELDLYGSSPVHPEALTRLPRLSILNLGETALEDLSFLPDMPALEDIDLRGNPLSDLTPLLECQGLNLLILSPRHQSLVEEQLGGASFQVRYQ